MVESDLRSLDAVPAAFKSKEARACRGKLKIFFGAAAGVGKTYSMLESACTARAARVDVVIGFVQQHGRIETERLVAGLEQIPFLEVSYRGITRVTSVAI
jgi:two-component system sensor histidine kinase KdpD